MKQSDAKMTGTRRRVVFAYYAPRAHKVFLLGDFNRWDMKAHPMKKDPDGVWQKITYLRPGRHEYLFMVDGRWCRDPRNLNRCPNLLRLREQHHRSGTALITAGRLRVLSALLWDSAALPLTVVRQLRLVIFKFLAASSGPVPAGDI